MTAVTAQTSTLAAIQYTTVAAARFVIGGMIGELLLTLVPEAPGVPVMPALPWVVLLGAVFVVMAVVSTLEVDTEVVLEVSLRESLDVNALLEIEDVLDDGGSGEVESVLPVDCSIEGVRTDDRTVVVTKLELTVVSWAPN